MLVQHLPPGGATYRAVHGHGWTELHYLLADLVDSSAATTTAVYRTVAGRRRVRGAKRYPRPGEKAQGKPIGDRGDRSTEEVLSYLHSLKPAEVKGA